MRKLLTRESILVWPNPALRQECQSIDKVDSEVQKLAKSMLMLVNEWPAAGLAAPQIGVPLRLFVTSDPTGETEGHVWINPHLEQLSDSVTKEQEGCLSLPDILVEVLRPQVVEINAINVLGKEIIARSDEWPCPEGAYDPGRVWQHEYDHLVGRLIIDRMSPLDRIRNRKHIRALREGKK